MDPRVERIRSCADFLSHPHGGDREIACLIGAVRASLELCVQILMDRGAPRAFGYKDALDKMVACGAIPPSLGERLDAVFHVAERMPTAWSSVHEKELGHILDLAPSALRDFADAAERHLGLETGLSP